MCHTKILKYMDFRVINNNSRNDYKKDIPYFTKGISEIGG